VTTVDKTPTTETPTQPVSPARPAPASQPAHGAQPGRPAKKHSALYLAICRLAGCEVDPVDGPAPGAEALFPAPATAPRVRPAEPDDTDAVVVADGLTKTYRGGVTAASQVSLTAHRGEIVAVVGPNGAGKSTTLNMLSGLLRPTAGSAMVAGVPTTDTRRLGAVLGVALQTSGLDPAMTGLEHFEVQGALYGMDRGEAGARTKALIEHFGLTPYANRQVAQFSGGLQRRLVLAVALLHDPPVIVLDEPTAGLDPQSRRMVWDLLDRLRQADRTIIFSTQMLEEADMLAQRIYVISDGKVVAQGAPAELRQAYGELTVRVRVTGSLEAAEQSLTRALPGLGDPRRDGDGLVFTTDHESPDAGRVVSVLTEAGIGYLEVTFGRPSLEDAFVRLTGATVRVEPLLAMGSTGGVLCRCS
jgi:ABC-2 type transport system ATP-binding protein